MAQARICERCGATFPITENFYNRIRFYYSDPENRGMPREIVESKFVDMEICHNCSVDVLDFAAYKEKEGEKLQGT